MYSNKEVLSALRCNFTVSKNHLAPEVIQSDTNEWKKCSH